MSYEYLLVSTEDNVATIQINRPDVLNALNMALMVELVDALEALDRDKNVGCIVITGNERAFAAGLEGEVSGQGPRACRIAGHAGPRIRRLRTAYRRRPGDHPREVAEH